MGTLPVVEGADETYLAELAELPLDRLSKEPDLLKQEAARIHRAMEDLAYSHYRAFLLTSECVHRVHQGVGNTTTSG